MRSTWRLGRWRGVPIYLHWTVLLGLAWFYYRTGSAVATLVSFAAFLFLLFAHELGHAAVATWRRVPVESIRLYFIHGTCTHAEPDYELDDILIAWGGVAVQCVLFICALVAEPLLAAASPAAHAAAYDVLRVFIDANLVIMIVNLIPVAPLDGATAWRILPIIGARLRRTSWAGGLRRLRRQRQRAKDRKLEEKSKQVVVDIVERLKKRKTDV